MTTMTDEEMWTEALCVAFPFAMAVRFDTLNHCIEAATASAGALVQKGVAATVLPVAMVAQSRENILVSIGLTQRDSYDKIPTPKPSWEEWKKDQDAFAVSMGASVPKENHGIHAVVDVRHRSGNRVLLDPTIGQISKMSIDLPAPILKAKFNHLPFHFDHQESRFHYLRSPRHDAVLAMVHTHAAGCLRFQNDLVNLMDLVVAVNLDVALFLSILATDEPVQTRRCAQKWMEWVSPRPRPETDR